MKSLSYILFFISSFILLSESVSAQTIKGISTRYNNSFRDWIIETEEDDRGELTMRWAFRDDWTEWDVEIGDTRATIEQKWKDDPNLWEIRCDGEVVNARTAWTGEFNRWKLTDSKSHYNWGTKYVNIRDEWLTDGEGEHFFQVYTYWEGDPRDWVVIDELPSDASMAMKIAMIFLAIHFSTPRI